MEQKELFAKDCQYLICSRKFVVSVITQNPLVIIIVCFVCFLWRCGPPRAMASSFLWFLDHTQRRITVGRTPLDAWSVRRRELYLTTQNIHNRQTSMPPVGFEPTVSASERPQTYALDRATTGTGNIYILLSTIITFSFMCLYFSAWWWPSVRSKHVVEDDDNKRVYIVYVLCLCSLDC